MHKLLSRSALALCLSGLLPALSAQAVYTATRSSRIQAGAGAMYLDNDATMRKNYGIAAWGDYDFYRFLGVEAEYHYGSIITPDDVSENSFGIGPRFSYRRNKLTVYGKLLFGRGTIKQEQLNQSSTYNQYAYGGGVEYRVGRKLNLRVPDIELQKWPDFYPHTLSPLSVTVGLSYIIR